MKIVKANETDIGNMEVIEAAKIAIQQYMDTPKELRKKTAVMVSDGGCISTIYVQISPAKGSGNNASQ